jgi:hypothetical protein
MHRFLHSGIVCLCLWTIPCLAGPAWAQLSDIPDAEIEKCLTEGKVGKQVGKLVGVTKPEHVEIDCPGVTDSAVFKYLDENRKGVTRLAGGATELNFTDSYKYERAAYLLDRQLGLNMVPVAVLRTVKGDDGALVAWIPDAVHEKDMQESPKGLQMVGLLQQKGVMRLFDALIYNVDRRPENWMVSSDDWRLYLIDHSRSFRVLKQLPEEFTEQKAWLSRDLYERLQALNEAQISESMAGLISGAQIESLLARRDLILEKIDGDRAQEGDEAVFFQ